LQFDPSGALTHQIVTEALIAISTHIFELWQQGARKFVVLNVPDISITPAVAGLPAPIPAIAQGLSGHLPGGSRPAGEQ
jgi:phospholipase/lecithinase/hemolysin